MGQSREALRRIRWMNRTRDHAKLLLNDLMKGDDAGVKALLSLLKAKYFTQDLAMVIHHLNIALAECERRHTD